jgi:ribosomal protein L11 methyltransferase
MGFESFTESEDGIQGYISVVSYPEQAVQEYLNELQATRGIRFSIVRIESRNWNEVWESGFEPVTIAGKCRVRAPFHPPATEVEYDLVIEPRMSFGTAHHETTALMLELLMDEAVQGKRVLDMGCGTGVLAILARKMGATEVVAIDNDEWAFSNALDNVEKNAVAEILVMMGDSAIIPPPEYDLILANINRNVLLEDIPRYCSSLRAGGTLLLSGFYTEDLALIRDTAEGAGLHYLRHRTENNWVAAKFVK